MANLLNKQSFDIKAGGTSSRSRLFVVAALIVTVATFVVAGSQTVFNALADTGVDDFENALAHYYTTHQYNNNAEFTYVTNNPDEAFSGNRSLRIISNDSVPEKNKTEELTRWLTRIDTLPATPGDEYRVEAMMRTRDVVDSATISVTFFDSSDWRSWSQTVSSPTSVSGNSEWTKVAVSFVVPDGTSFIRPEFRLYDRGTLWIDDYQVVNLSQANRAAVTASEAPVATDEPIDTSVVVTAPPVEPTPTEPTPNPVAVPEVPTQTTTPQSTPTPAPTPTPSAGPNNQLMLFNGTYTHIPTAYVALTDEIVGQTAPANFFTPLNYAEGNAYLRVKITDKPTSKRVGMQICMWQFDTVGGPWAGETCSPIVRGVTDEGEFYLDLGTPAFWWGTQPGDRDNNCSFDRCPPFDWSRIMRTVRVMIKEDGEFFPDGTVRDHKSLLVSQSCGGACYKGGDDLNQHVPITFEASMVMVPQGESFQRPASWSSCGETWCQTAQAGSGGSTTSSAGNGGFSQISSTPSGSNNTVTAPSNPEPISGVESFEGSIADYANHSYNGRVSFTHTNSAAEARSGNRALKLVSSESDPGSRQLDELTRWMSNIDSFEVTPGEQYRIQAYFKTQGAAEIAQLATSFFGGTAGSTYVAGSGQNATQTLTGTNDWTLLSVDVSVPFGARFMRPEFRLFDTGTLWIDDFSIEKLSDGNNSVVIAPPNTAPAVVTTPDDPFQPFQDGEFTINFPQSEAVSVYWKPGATPPKRIFTIFCDYSHTLSDDPIVFPNQPGRSHAHDFLGNNALNAFSTTQTLLDNGVNSCTVPEDRSAYWTPSVYDGGRQIKPTESKFYYRAGDLDPTTIRPMPVGLRMIAGNANATTNQSPQVGHWFTAKIGPLSSPATKTTRGANQMIQSDNRIEQGIRLDVIFPNCWDGDNLWLKNSTHVAYSIPTGGQFHRCPASHPVPIIEMTYNIHYPEADGGNDFRLSSGGGGATSWTSFHADFINGWHPEALASLTEACIRNSRYCQAVELETCAQKFAKGFSPVPTDNCIEIRPGAGNISTKVRP